MEMTLIAHKYLLRTGNLEADMDFTAQAIGSNPNAIAMKRVVNFYEKLPQGPAPEVKATGILGRYQAKHFGKNPSAKRKCFRDASPDERIEYCCADEVGIHSYHPRSGLPRCHWIRPELLLPPA